MKKVYPIILTPNNGEYLVEIPDFDIMTQGLNLANAIDMARDAICLMAIDLQKDNKPLPKVSDLSNVEVPDGSIATLVDIDIEKYRKKLDNISIRKNCTIPNWLNEKAEKAGVNFSQVLREALESLLR